MASAPWWHHARFYATAAGILVVYLLVFVLGVVALLGAVEAEFRFFGNVISLVDELLH